MLFNHKKLTLRISCGFIVLKTARNRRGRERESVGQYLGSLCELKYLSNNDQSMLVVGLVEYIHYELHSVHSSSSYHIWCHISKYVLRCIQNDDIHSDKYNGILLQQLPKKNPRDDQG